MALGLLVTVEAEQREPVALGAAAAVALVAFALANGRSAPIPFALLLLGAVYGIPEGEPAIPAPVFGAGLLLCAELAYWSLESRVAQDVYGDVVTPRLLAVLGVAATSLPAGWLVLLAGEGGFERSPALTAAAALAIAACAGLLAVLARAAAPSSTR